LASKTFEVPAIGTVTVYKRKGVKRVSMRFNGQTLRISQPSWMPYRTGLNFAISQKRWIETHKPYSESLTLNDGDRIGKTYILRVKHSPEVRTRITGNEIIIYCPTQNSSVPAEIIPTAKKAIYRALKKEANVLLGERLDNHAATHRFSFSSVTYKSMKSRWGSCNNSKEITLNIYLLMLPWELIDYVLIHELSHTIHLNHSSDFWNKVEMHIPNYKKLRKDLKQRQASIMALR
jgi:predicted metal-dependent hydrolase